MAQVQPTTSSVTSKNGTVYQNRPINLDNILRFDCSVFTYIGDNDKTLYPAIRFDVANTKKAVYFWIYPDTATRDADCEMLTDMVTPSSDNLAYWDVTGDNLPDLDPVAIYVGGVSGTHQADQLYFDQTGVPNPLAAPFDGIIRVRRDGVPYVLGDFDGADTSNLNDVSKWSGPFAGDLSMNFVGTIGHTNIMQFSKLPFADALGQVYSKAASITMTIKNKKGGLLSGNTGNVLTLGVRTSIGKLRAPSDIDFVDYGSNGQLVHVSLFATEGLADQGTVDIQNTSKKWSKKRFVSDITAAVGGTHARYYQDTDSPTGWSVIWSANLDAAVTRQEIYRSHILSFDVDGFPVYGQPVNINGIGETAGSTNTSSTSRPCIVPGLTTNGMPVVVIGKSISNARTASILVNTGTPASPDYSTFLPTISINARLTQLGLIRVDSQSRIYARHFLNTNSEFSRLVYSGINNDVAALTNAANWSREKIGIAVAASPALGGTGDLVQFDGWGCAVNEDLIVNSQPTIYVSDPTNHVIFQVHHNGGVFGDERDWTWVVKWGQSGVAGGTDGVGTLSTFNSPQGLVYSGGFLYCTTRTGHTVRRLNTNTLLTETYFGVNATLGSDLQKDF